MDGIQHKKRGAKMRWRLWFFFACGIVQRNVVRAVAILSALQQDIKDDGPPMYVRRKKAKTKTSDSEKLMLMFRLSLKILHMKQFQWALKPIQPVQLLKIKETGQPLKSNFKILLDLEIHVEYLLQNSAFLRNSNQQCHAQESWSHLRAPSHHRVSFGFNDLSSNASIWHLISNPSFILAQ